MLMCWNLNFMLKILLIVYLLYIFQIIFWQWMNNSLTFIDNFRAVQCQHRRLTISSIQYPHLCVGKFLWAVIDEFAYAVAWQCISAIFFSIPVGKGKHVCTNVIVKPFLAFSHVDHFTSVFCQVFAFINPATSENSMA